MKSKRHPELARLYWALATAMASFLAFRVYRLLSQQQASSLDPTSMWTLLGVGLFNALAITALIFIVGRSLAKVWLERRHGVLGARIRTKLVLALLAVGIVPSMLIYLIGRDFISQNIQRWFHPEIQQMLRDEASAAEALRRQIRERLALALACVDPTAPLEAQRKELGLDYLALKEDTSATSHALVPSVPHPQQTPLNQGAWVLQASVSPSHPGFQAGIYLPKDLADTLSRLDRRTTDARLLGAERVTLQSSAQHILLLLTLLSIFAAVWTGLTLSRVISEPVKDLADAAHRIGLGELDVRLPEHGKDEFAFLSRSFNHMAADLEASRRAIEHQAERIEAQRAYLGQLLEALPVGVMSWDATGALRTFNPTARSWFGVAANQPWERLTQDPHFGSLPTLLEAVRKNRLALQEEFRIGGEGEGRPVRAMIVPLEGDGALAVLEDLSALAQAEKRAAWQEVARRMAHEVKNPLTPIKLTAQRLLRRSKDGRVDLNSLAEGAETILNEVSSLQRLVDNFSQFAKLPVPVFRDSDAAELLRQVAALYVPNHPTVAWDLHLPEGPVPVVWDPDMVKRIVINLVDNALSVLPPQGSLRLSLEQEPHHVRLRVEDNGPGVPPDMRHRLFEPYFSTKKKGTGLGLAIVRRIAHDHGGDVHYEPGNPGSRFEVRLPQRAQGT